MRKCLNEALNRLAPPDEAWRRSKHRLIVGMSRIEHLGGLKVAWKSTNLTDGIRGVNVDGHRFFDGGIAELVPDITPEQIGLNSDPAKGPVDPVFSIDICSWGNLREGYHICPGFDVPVGWFFFPHNPGVLNKLFRLGYARAAECFAKVDPAIMADLWRPGMELSLAHLPGICEQVDELVSYLRDADPFCCIDAMLSSRKKYSKPQTDRLERMHIKQLPLPDTEEVLAQAAKKQLSILTRPLAGMAAAAAEAAEAAGTLAAGAGEAQRHCGGVVMPSTPAAVREYEERHRRAAGGAASSRDGGERKGRGAAQRQGVAAAAPGSGKGATSSSSADASPAKALSAASSDTRTTASSAGAAQGPLDSPAQPTVPRHALRPLPPLCPSAWLKDEGLRVSSLESMAKLAGSGRGRRVAPLPPVPPPQAAS
ncbi:hypothetical protein HYH03_014546 [Edaphochlamys debaryana]|uniref:Uncharacterized protein n=1 Tax=Edaphochlamys debaryana TaxID=47281 RepID=A0A835XQ07_9CHLO|nr:hypothetical protein HYH03_014546 [Edaphochlamys debaryana]|eukprot:KAG2486863.1 hypothetical protein HYH03_014546 [Edaphochlamys debaryana]